MAQTPSNAGIVTWALIIIAVIAGLMTGSAGAQSSSIALRAPWNSGEWWQPSTYPGHPPCGDGHEEKCVDFNKVSTRSVRSAWPYGDEVPNEDVNAPIVSAHSGTVYTHGGYNGGYGNYIDLRSDQDTAVVTRYAHLSSFNKPSGARVEAGETIGFCGTTGESTGVHLHFELRVNNVPTRVDTLSSQALAFDRSRRDDIGRWRGLPIEARGQSVTPPPESRVGYESNRGVKRPKVVHAWSINAARYGLGEPDDWLYGYGPGSDGRAQPFKGGVGRIITESGPQNFPAYYIQGTILQKYESTRDGNGRGGPWSPLGWLASDEMEAAPSATGTTGRMQRCQGGAIYYWRNGYYYQQAFEMHDDPPAGLYISSKYDQLGGSDGNQHADPDFRLDLGFPRSDTLEAARNPQTGRTGEVSFFEGGLGAAGAAIYGVRDRGTFVVHGRIFERHEALGGTDDPIGFPLSDPTKAAHSGAGTGADGLSQQFEGGRIFWRRFGESWGSQAWLLKGSILEKYVAAGETGSKLGFPINEPVEQARSDPWGTEGSGQGFEGGAIYTSRCGTAIMPDGALYDQWTATGRTRGRFGFPCSDQVRTPRNSPDGSPGYSAEFEGGAIYSSSLGAFGVYGEILTRWRALGGVAGWLGFPEGEIIEQGTYLPSGAAGEAMGFQGGMIVRSARGVFFTRGAVREKGRAVGWVRQIGYPTDDLKACGPSPAPWNTVGECQQFEGALVLASTAGAYVVTEPILARYRERGGVAGSLGFPTSDAYAWGGGTRQDFQGGYLTTGLTSPAELRAVAASPSQVTLTWVDTSDGENAFQVEIKGPSDAEFRLHAQVAANVTRVEIGGLTGGSRYCFRVRATSNSGSSPFSNVECATPGLACSITVISPNGGENWAGGENHEIRWTSNSLTGNVKLEFSGDGGATWTVIRSSTSNSGSYAWSAPNTPTSQGRIRISSISEPACVDSTDGVFTVAVDDEPQGRLVVSKALPFGTASLGRARDRLLKIRNASASDSLRITASDPGSPFTIVDAPRVWLLPPKGSVNLRLRFVPSTSGVHRGELILTSTDPRRGSITIKLNGRGR